MPNNIFDVHARALTDYQDFVKSFIHIRDEDAAQHVNKALQEENSLWPDFLLQVSPSYLRDASVDELAQQGLLLPQTAEIFRNDKGRPFHLYRHQVQALELARAGRSYVVTSGTGSGKSLTYFLPLVEMILREQIGADRTLALIIYPMNALVNSQLKALEDLKRGYEARSGQRFPVTFARYTGDTRGEERVRLHQRPPHVILSNYMMAELMLVRPDDQSFLDKAKGGLRFLVFDELHTYRGRQGADVAMLIRRLKERAAAENLIHVGTSATMSSERDQTPQQRRQVVADFSSRFFGHAFSADEVIEETLKPFTVVGEPTSDELRAAVTAEAPGETEVETFRAHPLSRWIERQFGIEPEPEGEGYRRRVPRTLAAAADALSKETGVQPSLCKESLRRWLSLGGSMPREDGGRAFAFKVHQFLGQGRTLFASLEAIGKRTLSLEGQLKDKEGRLLAPLRFCRFCGQGYYHVLREEGRFSPHPLGFVMNEEESSQAGYLVADAANTLGEPPIPDEWLDERGRVKATYKERVPSVVWVNADGGFAAEDNGGLKMWFQAQPFAVCLGCGEFYTRRESEYVKLGGLSSEGRSSASTVLASSLLRHARHGGARDKLLTFTDNRQDAALQAGHFNDMVQGAVLRAALVEALDEEPELTFERRLARVH